MAVLWRIGGGPDTINRHLTSQPNTATSAGQATASSEPVVRRFRPSRKRCSINTVRPCQGLLVASARSEVPPFMVMDVMAAAARIEAAGGHVIHLEVGQPAAPAPRTAIAAAHAALDYDADRLYLGARHSVAARAHRAALSRGPRLRGRSGADRRHHGLVGRLHPGVPVDVRAGRSRRRPRFPAIRRTGIS